jgi:hypothetical protein
MADTDPPVGTTPPIGSAPPVAIDPTDPPIAGPGGMPTYPPTLSTILETEPPVGTVPATDPPVGTTPIETAPPVVAIDPTDPPVAGPGNVPTYPPTPFTMADTDPPVGTTPPIGSAPPVAIDPTDPPVAGPGGMPTYPPTLSSILETEPPVGTVPATDPPVGTTPATDPPVSSPSDGGAVAVDDTATISSSDRIAFIAVIENDTPAAGQSLSVKRTDGASNGNCSIGLDLLEVVYQPDAGFVGADVCEYEACDDQEPPLCVSATVKITVT